MTPPTAQFAERSEFKSVWAADHFHSWFHSLQTELERTRSTCRRGCRLREQTEDTRVRASEKSFFTGTTMRTSLTGAQLLPNSTHVSGSRAGRLLISCRSVRRGWSTERTERTAEGIILPPLVDRVVRGPRQVGDRSQEPQCQTNTPPQIEVAAGGPTGARLDGYRRYVPNWLYRSTRSARTSFRQISPASRNRTGMPPSTTSRRLSPLIVCTLPTKRTPWKGVGR